jgi:dCTP deaminase
MGILGRSAIIEQLRSGRLTVSPLLSKEQLGAASIDLRVGNVVLTVRARGTSHVDPVSAKANASVGGAYDIEFGRQQKHERFEIPFKSVFLLHPGSLALVPTLEWVKLPEDIHGSVTARSTWAREGLSIATATFIEPLYQGIVTLELLNLGPIPLSLYPGLKIAQIAFSQVTGRTYRSESGQFSMSFEPTQGTIAKEDDFPFIPDRR